MRHIAAALLLLLLATPALAIDEIHRKKAEEMCAKASGYLIGKQDPASGGWSTPGEGDKQPHLPGITALVMSGLMMGKGAETASGPVLTGAKYLLNLKQPDGGIYDRMLPSYNTSLALSALCKVDLPQAREAVPQLQKFLRDLQWSDKSDPASGGSEAPKPVGKDHAFYGGVGYGMQAMQDSGVSAGDESVQRAVVFLQRLQMLDGVNEMPYAKGSRQGGFIYATVESAQSVDGRAGQSMAGEIEETLDDGTRVSRLRCYGSMSYAGFKSYLYAELPRDDPRVKAALDWIAHNYTVTENPGMGSDGLYYYYVAFARALRAWGAPKLEIKKADGTTEQRDWANDLIDQLATLQNDDGSFEPQKDRWMESDPTLITAYALIALREASVDR